jgi:hypothetical protein
MKTFYILFPRQTLPRHNGLVASLLLFSPKSTSLNTLGSFDNPAAVEANENLLLKMLAHSHYGEMVSIL